MVREKILRALARFACRHHKLVIILGCILTALAYMPMLSSGYTSAFNVSRMLPQDIPASRSFTRAITDFGTADEAIVLFRLNTKNERSVEIAGTLADTVAARVLQNADINSAFCQLLTKAEKDQLLNVELPRHGMLLLPEEDLDAIKNKLQTDRINASVKACLRRLTSGTVSDEMQQQILMDALGLGSIFKDSFGKMFNPGGDKEEQKEKLDKKGYLVSDNGEMLLLVIEPKYAAQSIRFSRRIMEFIEQSTYDCMFGAKEIAEKDCADWPGFFSTYTKARDVQSNTNLAKFHMLLTEKEQKAIAAIAAQNSGNTGTAQASGEADTQPEELQLSTALSGINRVMRTENGAKVLAGQSFRSGIKNKSLKSYVDSIRNLSGIDQKLLGGSINLRLCSGTLNSLCGEKIDPTLLTSSPLPTGALKAFRVDFAGGYEIARSYGEKLNGVLVGTLIISAICVLAFFGYCFRRFGVLLYVGVPLFMIISWTAGTGWILFGQLNLVSCAFAAVLVGLGIDYAVHIYNRYIEERAVGGTVERSFEVAIGHTGWGVIVGMVTTCMAFLSLNVTRFTQLSEFGALGAIGIFLSAPAMMLVMPALVAWRSKNEKTGRVLHPSEFFLPQVARIVFAQKKTVATLSTIAILICISALLVPGSVAFDPSMAALRPRDKAFEINGEIADTFASRNPNKLTFMVLGDTEEDALSNMASYEEKMQKLVEKGLITGYESVTRYLPAPQEQYRRIEKLSAIDFTKAEKDFRAALASEDLDPDYFGFNFRLLQNHAKLVEEKDIILPSDFAGTKISRLVNRYIAQRQKEYFVSEGDFPTEFPVTLAKAAAQFEDNLIRYPAGTKLTEKQVKALNPPGQHPSERVKSITVYEGGYAVKATVYPPVEKGAHGGEPVITTKWLKDVAQVLGLEPEQFEAKANLRDFPATLTGVSVVSSILADIVKEDFLRISILITLICFCVVNMFYHSKPLVALIGVLPLAVMLLGWKQLTGMLPVLQSYEQLYLYTSLAVFVLTNVVQKRLGRTLLCFLPVSVGLLYMFGLMAVVNLLAGMVGLRHLLDLNFVNVLTIPIIIGVGVDNGIHLVNRYFESGRRIKPVVVGTGRALAITALTSMVGFGSLYWAKLQGLDSIAQLGVLSVIALAMVLLTSVVVFPAIVSLLAPSHRKQRKKSGKR